MEDLSTPLLDSVNRKLTDTGANCADQQLGPLPSSVEENAVEISTTSTEDVTTEDFGVTAAAEDVATQDTSTGSVATQDTVIGDTTAFGAQPATAEGAVDETMDGMGTTSTEDATVEVSEVTAAEDFATQDTTTVNVATQYTTTEDTTALEAQPATVEGAIDGTIDVTTSTEDATVEVSGVTTPASTTGEISPPSECKVTCLHVNRCVHFLTYILRSF